MFFARRASLRPSPRSPTAAIVSAAMSISMRWHPSSEPSESGFESSPAFFSWRGAKPDESRTSRPPARRSARWTLRAAALKATRTSMWSPWLATRARPTLIEKEDTPAGEPAGARISAGKSGKVAKSLRRSAAASVKSAPTVCTPSPESPANRTRTKSTPGSMGISRRRIPVVSSICRRRPGDRRERGARGRQRCGGGGADCTPFWGGSGNPSLRAPAGRDRLLKAFSGDDGAQPGQSVARRTAGRRPRLAPPGRPLCPRHAARRGLGSPERSRRRNVRGRAPRKRHARSPPPRRASAAAQRHAPLSRNRDPARPDPARRIGQSPRPPATETPAPFGPPTILRSPSPAPCRRPENRISPPAPPGDPVPETCSRTETPWMRRRIPRTARGPAPPPAPSRSARRGGPLATLVGRRGRMRRLTRDYALFGANPLGPPSVPVFSENYNSWESPPRGIVRARAAKLAGRWAIRDGPAYVESTRIHRCDGKTRRPIARRATKRCPPSLG